MITVDNFGREKISVMAVKDSATFSSIDAPLLLEDEEIVEGAVDYKGEKVKRSKSGGWRSAPFFIGVETIEKFAYYGVSSNLISYLTGPLHQSIATAAENVNAWSGTSLMLPLLGALIADSYIGRYRTILIASLLYILALGLLTISALIPSSNPSDCQSSHGSRSCSDPPKFQVIFFFFSLYLVAFAQGGHKPCSLAFGADQFDVRDPEEFKSRSSFFNWCYFGTCVGTFITVTFVNYIQENLGWGLGFGIPCISMVIALIVFLIGTKTYRYSSSKEDEKNPFLRITQVFVLAVWNRKSTAIEAKIVGEENAREVNPLHGAHQFKFLDKAMISVSETSDYNSKRWEICTLDQVNEAKAVLRLIPIWFSCLVYAIVFSQSSTFFTKQGATMDRSIGSSFKIPAASIQSLICFSIIVCIPIYDFLFVPLTRSITGLPTGLTMLQRIGIGMFVSVISMVVAAIVEQERLKIASESGLIDSPEITVPMRVWWLIPQYVLFGVADVFTMVGLQEFFYDQVPQGLRSVGLSLFLSILGVGSFLSSFLVSAIDKATSGNGHDSWFSDDLNRAHIDYFYWVLAGLSVIEMAAYLYFTKSYHYKSRTI